MSPGVYGSSHSSQQAPHQRGTQRGHSCGTRFRRLSMRVPLPPLDEQRQIVAILNRAAKIERLRAQAVAKKSKLSGGESTQRGPVPRANMKASQARERDEFSAAQQRKNSAISEFKRRFESGETDAIDEYCEMVFERFSYPKSRRYCAPSTRSSESCYTEPVQGAVVNGWATVTNRSGPGATR